MPRLAQPLSDSQIKRAKAQTKLVKLFDGHGLYLEVHPSGGKFWRFRYRKSRARFRRYRRSVHWYRNHGSHECFCGRDQTARVAWTGAAQI